MSRMSKIVLLSCLAVLTFGASQRTATAEPLCVRMENFVVTPSTGRVVNVLVENRCAAGLTMEKDLEN